MFEIVLMAKTPLTKKMSRDQDEFIQDEDVVETIEFSNEEVPMEMDDEGRKKCKMEAM